MPNITKTKIKQIGSFSRSSTLAEKLMVKRKAREEYLHAEAIKKSGRVPIVALVKTDAVITKELKKACEVLDLHLVEVTDVARFDFLVADIAVFTSLTLGQGKDAEVALKAGVVPVIVEKIAPKNIAENYDPTAEQGNSFFATQGNSWALFAALVRACETYRFSYDWQGIVRNIFDR